MSKDYSGVLIVTPLAHEFVAEIERLSKKPIPVQACVDAAETLTAWDGHKILFGNPGIIAPILEKLPGVEWIQSSWAGVTPMIDASRRDYVLTGVKDVFGPQMSEFTFGYLLAHELKIAERSRQQTNKQWFGEHSGMLEGKTIGIMGTGSIGAHIARTAQAFSMTVYGFSRTGSPTKHFDQVFTRNQLKTFLRASEYLVSTLPQTPGTDGLLNSSTIAHLPDNAYLVNVGRSNVIDDVALIKALESGQLSGAVLDVFDEEPLPAGSPLWETKNLLVTAHISAVSHPLLLVPIFIENYWRFVAGQPLNHVVDFAAGY
jgi:phosphoglycerate dehydrogenase-like enzyme